MARTKISEFSATPGNNTDIDGINIAEGCAPSGINDAIRELMSQLKDFQAGTAGDSFNGPVGTTTAAAGAFTTLSASSTVSGTGFSTYLASPPAIGGTAAAAGSFTTLSASSTVTLSGGTANGVLYLNGSKVATSGSALTFDGTTLGVGASGGGYRIAATAATNLAAFSDGSTQNLFLTVTGGSGSAGAFTFNANNGGALVWQNAGAEQMRLTSTGLGIGTTTINNKLEVGGVIAVQRSTNTAKVSTLSNESGNFVITADSTYNMIFNTGGGEKMRLDTSGNLGLSVTPSGWFTNRKALQIGGAAVPVIASAVDGFDLMNNSYTGSGAADYYVTTGYAAKMRMGSTSGQFQWFIAPSGTAGNAITFTQAMTLDASGNLVLGQTSTNYRLQVANGYSVIGSYNTTSYAASSNSIGGSSFSWNRSSGGAETNIVNLYDNATLSFEFAQKTGASTANRLYQLGSTSHIWFTGDTERARITSSGDVIIGGVSANGKFMVYDANASIRATAPSGPSIRMYAGTVALLETSTNDDLLIRTNSTECARFTTGGNLLVGTTSNATYSEKFNITTGSATQTIMNLVATGTSAFGAVKFRNGSGEIGSISYLSGGVVYNTTSDPRLKTLIGSVTGSGERIDALQPVEFEWKADGKRARGFFADKFQEVYPDSVTGEKDAVDAEGNPVYQQMQASTAEVIADLVAELQSLRKRVAQLEKGN